MKVDSKICSCGHWWKLHEGGACTTCGCLLQLPTEDEQVFGHNVWVYCSQHMKPHLTGWCSVSPRDKVGLGVTTAAEAYKKCREWGFALTGKPQ